MAADTRAALQQLLETLEAEEEHILQLIELAGREREALVANDFSAMDDITGSMLGVAGELETCEERRASLLAELGRDGASLKELVALAEDEGIDGFSLRGERLEGAVGQLQELQEQNARLIISASNLRERWLGMLTRLASPTYTQRGHETSAGARLVSRSA